MNLISTCIFWTWLLGVSLVIPTRLPAGGGSQKSIIIYRESNKNSPLIAFKELNLLSSASSGSVILARVTEGTPINVLQVWNSADTGQWLLVNVLTQNFNQLFYKRGWVNIRTS